MLRFLVGDVARVSAQHRQLPRLDGIEDVATATLRFTNGATGMLNSVWHDNLARPSLRRVEVFCERRHIVIEGDDWFGPVSWTDTDGTTGALQGEALEAAVAPMRDGSSNPDGEFVRAVVEGRAATPDLAHRGAGPPDGRRDVRIGGGRWRGGRSYERDGGGRDQRRPTPTRCDVRYCASTRPPRKSCSPRTNGRSSWHLGVAGRRFARRHRELGAPRPRRSAGRATPRHGHRPLACRAPVWVGCCWRPAASGRRRRVSPLVWARARDTALAFYVRHGFRVTGDGFVDEATQLPHHVVVRRLD